MLRVKLKFSTDKRLRDWFALYYGLGPYNVRSTENWGIELECLPNIFLSKYLFDWI